MDEAEPTSKPPGAGEPSSVDYPVDAAGRRSTSALGRSVVADALRPVDPTGARGAEQETAWRSGYVLHFRRLLEAGLVSSQAALVVAEAGLTSLHRRMVVGEGSVATWAQEEGGATYATTRVEGSTAAERELTLPYRGERLRGDALRDRLVRWVADGVVEPGVAEAVVAVQRHPDWLRLEGTTVAVLGAAAEMGPLQALQRWGATVAAVDLARPDLWERVLGTAHAGAGTVLAPGRPVDGMERLGADLVREAPAVADWLAGLEGRLVVGNYVYADGADNARVSTAVDALTTRLLQRRPETALAFLATPTDVFAVPGDAVRQATDAYARRSRLARTLGRPLRTVSGGRLLRPPYAVGVDPGTNDSLVPQQGPNYALAKRIQRWRATTARAAGTTVSLNVAPPTRTRSVLRNRALAAAYAGAHRFGVEVFEPATANVLMAALLVHDLHAPAPRREHPWQDEAVQAVHGGLWRCPYAPRSALGLAALLGYGAARG